MTQTRITSLAPSAWVAGRAVAARAAVWRKNRRERERVMGCASPGVNGSPAPPPQGGRCSSEPELEPGRGVVPLRNRIALLGDPDSIFAGRGAVLVRGVQQVIRYNGSPI